MNRVDGVILGIGAIVLIASIMGVVFYEDDARRAFTITWGEGEERALDEITDSVGPGEHSYEADVDGEVLHSVTFSVSVNAQNSPVTEDTVAVTATGPQGQTAECDFAIAGTSDGGSCDAVAQVNEEPDVNEQQAADSEQAQQGALEEATSDEGVGTWELTVNIDEGTELTSPSYEITVSPSVTEWDALAERPGIDTPR